jgi:hypothetical protein
MVVLQVMEVQDLVVLHSDEVAEAGVVEVEVEEAAEEDHSGTSIIFNF